MKTVVIKTSDGNELAGRVSLPDKPSFFSMFFTNDFIVVKDPLSIKYKIIEEVPTAVFVRYDAYSDKNQAIFNKSCIVSMYDLSDTYTEMYESSVKSLNEEAARRRVIDDETKKDPDKDYLISTLISRALSNTSLH